MTQLRKDFQGCREVQTFSGARVEAMGDCVQLALRVPRQVRSLGQVLAQQPIGVLVGAALPGAIRIGKEHPNVESLSQALMLGHLFSPIIGQGFPQQCGQVPDLVREPVAGTFRISALHPCQEDQPRGPLYQGPDRRPIARALDQIAFSVAGHRAGGHLRGALSNRRHVGDLAPSVCPSRPRPSRLARRFSAHGAGGASQHSGHHPQRMTMGQTYAQSPTVFRTHVSIGSRYHGNTIAHQGR